MNGGEGGIDSEPPHRLLTPFGGKRVAFVQAGLQPSPAFKPTPWVLIPRLTLYVKKLTRTE